MFDIKSHLIFLDPRIHPVQYLHTLIHELAHIILGHRGFDLVDIMGAEAAAALGIPPLSGHLRAPGRSRDVLYPFGWLCVLICLIVLRMLNAPLALIACMGALLVRAPLQWAINRYVTKISMHSAIATGSFMTLLMAGKLVHPALVIGYLIIVLLTLWSRIETRNHSVLQVTMGALGGVLPVLLVFPLVL